MNKRISLEGHIDRSEFISGVWSERIIVVTDEYFIEGYVFMPKTGKRNRLLSDILNTAKRFVAIKDCIITYRGKPDSKPEKCDFLQLNLNSIILLRPFQDTK